MIPCYFAMPTTYYGTRELRFDLNFLTQLEYDPYVPSSEADQQGYKEKGMDYFKELLQEKQFKALVFRSFHRGAIGKGVAFEAVVALNMGIPVLELVERSYHSPLLTFAPIGRAEIQARELTIFTTCCGGLLNSLEPHFVTAFCNCSKSITAHPVLPGHQARSTNRQNHGRYKYRF